MSGKHPYRGCGPGPGPSSNSLPTRKDFLVTSQPGNKGQSAASKKNQQSNINKTKRLMQDNQASATPAKLRKCNDGDKPQPNEHSPNSNSRKKSNAEANVEPNMYSSLESMATDPTGIISPNCKLGGNNVEQISDVETDTESNFPSSQPTNASETLPANNENNQQQTARIDLSKPEFQANLPTSTRQVYITTADSNNSTSVLTRINPFKLGKEIESICGPVTNIEYKKSGNILITTNSLDQVKKLLETKRILDNITVKVIVAWNSTISEGKLYAPEFSNESLEELLELLKPFGVIAVRKLLRDPLKSHVPLFVLSFLSPKCPQTIKTSYTVLHIDPFIPSPRMCGRCCRYGHSSQMCSNKPVCDKCGSRDHKRESCNSGIIKCVNCKGNHTSRSKNCPAYVKEVNICNLKASEGISFQEARKRFSLNTNQNLNPQPVPNLLSEETFPSLPNTFAMNNQCSELPILSNNSTLPDISSGTPPNDPDCLTDNGGLSQCTPSPAHSYITPAQRTRPRGTLGSTPDRYNDVWSTQASTQHPSISSQSISKSIENTLMNLVSSLLPLLIKLTLSSNITDKIESLLEVGTLLKSESVVSKTLDTLGHSSLASRQI